MRKDAGIIVGQQRTALEGDVIGYMQVPLDEIANYPRFHEAAGAAFDIAGHLFGGHGLVMLCCGDRRITAVKSSGNRGRSLPEGTAIALDSKLAMLLSQAMEHGPFLHETSMITDDIDANGVAIAPVVLGDGRRFGAMVVLLAPGREFPDHHLDVLASLAELTALAVDGELRGMHDRLTGLYSRAMFDDHLELELARARRNGNCLAVLVLGCEMSLSSVPRGEPWWLARISERLLTSVRRGDTVARIGAREFGLIVPDLRDTAAAHRVARTLVELLADPLYTGDIAVEINPSVGVSLAPPDGFNSRQLVERAVQAMEQVRSSSGGGYALYSGARLPSVQTALVD